MDDDSACLEAFGVRASDTVWNFVKANEKMMGSMRRRAALEWHPDKSDGCIDKEEKMKQMNNSWEPWLRPARFNLTHNFNKPLKHMMHTHQVFLFTVSGIVP